MEYSPVPFLLPVPLLTQYYLLTKADCYVVMQIGVFLSRRLRLDIKKDKNRTYKKRLISSRGCTLWKCLMINAFALRKNNTSTIFSGLPKFRNEY